MLYTCDCASLVSGREIHSNAVIPPRVQQMAVYTHCLPYERVAEFMLKVMLTYFVYLFFTF